MTDQRNDPSRRAFEDAQHRLFARYGMEVQSRLLELVDPPLRAHVVEAGNGPPVLLVHGGGCVAALWAPLMAELRPARLLAVDRPGCGLTDAFDYKRVDLRQHAVAFLGSLIEELGVERVAIVANSMGGLWSLWLALDRPEQVSRLALLGCSAVILGSSAPVPMRLLTVPMVGRAMVALEPPSRRQVRRLFRRLGHRTTDRWPDEIWDAYEAYERLPGSASSYRTAVGRIIRLRGPRPEVELREEELRRVDQPTLFIWGDADPFGRPDVGRRAAGIMPNASFREVGAGHLPWLGDAAGCAELVRTFLLDDPRSLRPGV